MCVRPNDDLKQSRILLFLVRWSHGCSDDIVWVFGQRHPVNRTLGGSTKFMFIVWKLMCGVALIACVCTFAYKSIKEDKYVASENVR